MQVRFHYKILYVWWGERTGDQITRKWILDFSFSKVMTSSHPVFAGILGGQEMILIQICNISVEMLIQIIYSFSKITTFLHVPFLLVAVFISWFCQYFFSQGKKTLRDLVNPIVIRLSITIAPWRSWFGPLIQSQCKRRSETYRNTMHIRWFWFWRYDSRLIVYLLKFKDLVIHFSLNKISSL